MKNLQTALQVYREKYLCPPFVYVTVAQEMRKMFNGIAAQLRIIEANIKFISAIIESQFIVFVTSSVFVTSRKEYLIKNDNKRINQSGFTSS